VSEWVGVVRSVIEHGMGLTDSIICYDTSIMSIVLARKNKLFERLRKEGAASKTALRVLRTSDTRHTREAAQRGHRLPMEGQDFMEQCCVGRQKSALTQPQPHCLGAYSGMAAGSTPYPKTKPFMKSRAPLELAPSKITRSFLLLYVFAVQRL
jgi:hypothetical protein